MHTASANYRPGNSNTALRRKTVKSTANKQRRPAAPEEAKKSEKSVRMDPAEDSFHISPMNSQKYPENNKSKNEEQAKKPAEVKDDSRKVDKKTTGNITISGVSEFDYLGSEERDDIEEEGQNQEGDADDQGDKNEDEADFDPTRKSLEKDF